MPSTSTVGWRFFAPSARSKRLPVLRYHVAHNADRPCFSTPLTLLSLAGKSALVVGRSGDVLRLGKPNASQQVDLSDIFDSFFGGGGGMGGGGGRQQQRRQGPVRGTPSDGNPTTGEHSIQNQTKSVKIGCMVFGSILSFEYHHTAQRNDVIVAASGPRGFNQRC